MVLARVQLKSAEDCSSPKGTDTHQVSLLAQIRSLGLLPTGLTGSAEIWLDHAEIDRLKVCPIIVMFAQAMTCGFLYFFQTAEDVWTL